MHVGESRFACDRCQSGRAFRVASEAVGPILMVKPDPLSPITPDAGVVFAELPELRILALVDCSSRGPCAHTRKKCAECGDYSHKIKHRLP